MLLTKMEKADRNVYLFVYKSFEAVEYETTRLQTTNKNPIPGHSIRKTGQHKG